MSKPVLTEVPRSNSRPDPGNISKKKIYLNFSFKDFSQAQYFGLSHSSNNWFVAVFEQLKKIGEIEVEKFHKDRTLQSELRYHPIVWNKEVVKFNRNYFNWIDKDVLSNESEFPFYQFQITTGLGRIIGYWYEATFYVVGFDPLHNLQPSKRFNYQIQSCWPVESDLANLLRALDRIKRMKCDIGNCKVKSALHQLPNPLKDTNAVLLFLEDDYLEQFEKLLNSSSVSEMVEEFLIYKMD